MAGGDRDKALDAALANIERQFGKGSVMRLGDETRAPLEVIPTGAIALDVALGLGGLPRGRVVEVYGPESSGKTTVALHAVANAQRAGGIVAFIDAEHALDPEYAKALGVDTDALLVSQPDSGEQALEIADMLIRSGALDIIVIDSVAALVVAVGGTVITSVLGAVTLMAFGLAAASFFPVILMGIFYKRMNKEGAIAGMLTGLAFTFCYIVYFKFVSPDLNSAEHWLLGVSPEGIGTVGMLLNFAVAFAVSRVTAPPPEHIQHIVEDIRVPRGAGEAVAH